MRNLPSCPVSRSRESGVIFRFLLFCVLLISLASLAGVRVMRNFHIRTARHSGGDDVAFETPAGSFRVHAHEAMDPAVIGVPVYPGARRTDSSGGAEFEWISADGRNEKGMSVAGAKFITTDSPSKVIEFYRGQFSNLVVIREHGKHVRLEYTEHGLKRIIAIQEESDGTHIGVAAVGPPASN
jgi:hypothetical protein